MEGVHQMSLRKESIVVTHNACSPACSLTPVIVRVSLQMLRIPPVTHCFNRLPYYVVVKRHPASPSIPSLHGLPSRQPTSLQPTIGRLRLLLPQTIITLPPV